MATAKKPIKKAQDGDSLSPYQKKRAAQQIVRQKNIRARDSILNRNAAARGMTREQVQAQQEKDKKKPDTRFNNPGSNSSGGYLKSPCKGGVCTGLNTQSKNGTMIKRADGSFSKRGLWDNIRANKGSGKKPTKQMLVQEKKIKANTKK